ncbi:Ig-like domain-containing protein, partial [Xanthovirga aplysinae]|uniref:Ig-like domain-containing protein n=1 Tax=Xanthovirga aplysinae TaxID=2529853 RepID=UPI0016575E5D
GEGPRGDYNYELRGGSQPQMVFKPGYLGVGDNIVIFYYTLGANASGAFPGYVMQKDSEGNFTYPLNISPGQDITFYFTYSVPEGGERNSLNNKVTVSYQGEDPGEDPTPEISITSPSHNQEFVGLPSRISLSANTTISSGSISRVEYYANNQKIAESNLPPYQAFWNASQAGNYTIYAKAISDKNVEETSGTVAITVEADEPTMPVLARIDIPGASSAIKVGESFQFTARGIDENGNSMSVSPSWSVSGGGSISSNGLFTASAAGTFTVTASSSGITGNQTFTVENNDPGNPSDENCVGEGPNGDYTYEVESGDSPTITFKAGRPGVGNQIVLLYYTVNGGGQPYPGYQMTANGDGTFAAQLNAREGQTVNFYFTYSVPEGGERNSMNNEHSITIGDCSGSTDPGTGTPVLSNIVISTPSSPISIGQSYTFTARGLDQNGNEMSVDFEWSVNGGGQINAQTGAFTATTSGNYTVTARIGEISRSASFRVGEPTDGGGDLPDCNLLEQLINGPDAARNRSIFD